MARRNDPAPKDALRRKGPGKYAPGDSPAKASLRRGRAGGSSRHVVQDFDIVQDILRRARSHPWEVLPGFGEGAVAGEVKNQAQSGRPGVAAGLALAAAIPVVGGPVSRKLARELAKKGGKISAAAIKLPNGTILEGTSHFDAMERGGVSNSPMLKKAVSGYVDQSGAFLTLDEAGERLKRLGLTGDAWKNARSEEILNAQKGFAPKFEKAPRSKFGELKPDTLYHGTLARPFRTFKTQRGDVGVHLGTFDQAEDRLRAKRVLKNKPDDAGRVAMVEFTPQGKVLSLPDVDYWNSANAILAAIQKKDPALAARLVKVVEKETGMSLKWAEVPGEYLTKPLREEGFDAIRYKNKFEGKRGGVSTVALDPSRVRVLEQRTGRGGKKIVGDSVVTALPTAARALTPHSERAGQLLKLLKDNGGFTLNAKGEPVTSGFAVGAGKLPGANLLRKPLKDLTEDDLSNFLSKHPEGELLGGWVDNGEVFIEPSTHVKDKAAAIKLGRERKELAVGDLAAYARGDFDAGTVKLPQAKGIPEWARVEDSGDRLALYDTRKPNQPLVGYVLTSPDGEDGLKARAAFVSEKYRRQGLGTAMYDHIEETRGKPMRPSSEQSVDSRAFWESRSKRGAVGDSVATFAGRLTTEDVTHERNGTLRVVKKGQVVTVPKKVQSARAVLPFTDEDFAAIRLDDGRIFRGPDHASAVKAAIKAGVPDRGGWNDRAGFVLKDGRFVDREEGARIFRDARERFRADSVIARAATAPSSKTTISLEPNRGVDEPPRMRTPWDEQLKRIGALDSVAPKGVRQVGNVTEEPGGVKGVTFDTPTGKINVRFTHDAARGTPLDVKTISSPKQGVITDKTPGANARGVGAIREVFRKLKEMTGAEEVTGRRVSGASKGKRVDRTLGDTLFHGTFKNFDEFKLSDKDIGVHLGTPPQAHARLKSTVNDPRIFIDKAKGDHPQLLKVVTPYSPGKTINHPQAGPQQIVSDPRVLSLPDLGQWKIKDLHREITSAFDNGWEVQDLHTHDEIREWLRKEKGKGAISYKNDFEAPEDMEHSLAVFDPREAKIIASLDMSAAAQDRRMFRAAELRNKGATPKQLAEEMKNEWRPRGVVGDSVVAKAAGGIPEQKDLPRMMPKKKSQSLLDEVEERTLRAYMGPKFEKWLTTGNFGDWYDTFGTEQAARDALGDEEGPAAFKRLMDFMGATTARSSPSNNLRRAGYYRGLENAGLLDFDALLGRKYKKVPEGMGHIANDAHQNAMAALLGDGEINSIANPKPASFTENLKRNQRPFTNDTRMATGLRHVDPVLEKLGAFTKSTNPYGGVTYSPRDWAYAPMERAGQRAAHEYAGRGLANVRPGLDPTAFFQAKVWDALGGEIPGASRSAGQFDDVFKTMLDRNAKAWGLKPSEANKLFWQGHPFDLPLGKDVVPRGLLNSFR